MIKKTMTIKNKLGIHARPAALLVQTANKFVSDITIERDNQKTNCKSIMGIMMLALEHGANFDIIANGSDENNAIEEIVKLIDDKFGEE